mmetsp:Transcript_17285/g.41281  ORF Transcript_17285/g.41281 Transcript_17285/m.41281 type:complete len:295 (-) Transcript_17285:99-983(-)|eukprot:CAMPEP_0177627318 /NCGR_PEP_ID=MMETSP0419_2-20121207/31138_1 /TAXON_ID=582737 /ORGANISM="Tetraselmis sp., Strain GSL018" /LENGTH=294 /DNA_ID=CAMNT_0019128461 /DNA_START=111 /DNA_END=998 /DNA_ORIENTATION=-
MPFGQLVIGPPGSGKTTYCCGIEQYLEALGRKVAVVNLDPANDPAGYEAAVDIQDLVSLEVVQDELHLGPNGAFIYSLEFLAKNVDWLKEKLEPLESSDTYVLFDLPGQVELFSVHGALKAIVEQLTRRRGWRLAAVHLVDAHLCTDPAKYMSALAVSLSTMLHLELPHINVLSKMDLLETYGELPLPLEFFTEGQDLRMLADHMAASGGRFGQRYKKLTQGICETIEDFGLVHFIPLAIEDKDLVHRVLTEVDKANGYAFAHADGNNPYPQIASKELTPRAADDVSDKYLSHS